MKTTLTALLCILTFFSFAQKNFKKGFIVTNSSDTIRGYINYVEQNKNPNSILFKDNIDDVASRKYTVQDLKYLEIEGYEYYTRCVCNISMDQPQGYNIPTGEDSTSIIDTVLLRTLFFGNRIQLFTYTDKVKTRYYIKKAEDNDPAELIYRRFYDIQNPSMIKENKNYQFQLMRLAMDMGILNSQLKNRIENTTYTKHLVSLVKFINGDTEHKFENARKNKSSRLFVQAGFNRSDYKFSGDAFHERMNFTTSYAPVVGMGVDLFFNPSIGKLLFRPEIMFTMNNFEGTEYSPSTYSNNTYKLKRYLLGTNFSLLYNFYNAEKIKFFVGGGLAFNYIIYPENSYSAKRSNNVIEELTPYDFKNYSADFAGRAGFVFNNKFEVSLVANYPLVFSTNYAYFHDVHTYQQVRFGYLLSKKNK